MPKSAKREVNVAERLSEILKSLDNFLNYLQKENPEIFEDYIKALTNKFRSLLEKSDLTIQKQALQSLLEEIRSKTEVHSLYLLFAIQLMDISQNLSALNNNCNIDIYWTNHDKSSTYPAYYRALVLCEILGREKALEFLKRYIDTIVPTQVEPDLNVKDLDPFWKKWKQDPKAKNARPSHFIEFRLHRGKWGGKVFKCLIHDVMKPLNDPELSFITACYGDTAQIEAINPNFAFTRTKTLMQGDSFCDACLHDQRHVEKIEHPNEEFFNSLSMNT